MDYRQVLQREKQDSKAIGQLIGNQAALDGVRIHYNSPKPALVQAYAYTQGNQVYLGPGQERHLPHELGHVAQQAAGRVRATGSVAGQPLNDDPGLEREADSCR